MEILSTSSSLLAILGAGLAAAIAGFVALVNIVVTKEQDVSKFRQAWIDALRVDLAELLRHCSALANRHIIGTEHNVTREPVDALRETTATISSLEDVYTRIRLRLNPLEHQALLALLKEMEKAINSSGENVGRAILSQMDPIVEESQKLLKREWIRVKKGEPAYRVVKGFASVVLMSALAFAAYHWGEPMIIPTVSKLFAP